MKLHISTHLLTEKRALPYVRVYYSWKKGCTYAHTQRTSAVQNGVTLDTGIGPPWLQPSQGNISCRSGHVECSDGQITASSG
jgi:hypothetical protein